MQRVWTKLPLDEPFQSHHCSKERPRAASPHPPWSQAKQWQGGSACCLHLLQVLLYMMIPKNEMQPNSHQKFGVVSPFGGAEEMHGGEMALAPYPLCMSTKVAMVTQSRAAWIQQMACEDTVEMGRQEGQGSWLKPSPGFF